MEFSLQQYEQIFESNKEIKEWDITEDSKKRRAADNDVYTFTKVSAKGNPKVERIVVININIGDRGRETEDIKSNIQLGIIVFQVTLWPKKENADFSDGENTSL